MQKILIEVLRKIKPGLKEKKEMKDFVDKIIQISKPIAKIYSARPMLCGSVVKNTWLSGRNEMDLFLLFSPILPKKKLEEHGMAIAKETIKQLKGSFKIAYAEHPYLKGKAKYKKKEYDIDIVPAYNVADPKKIKSSVDRTPYHVKYVKKRLTVPNEVRLLKQFCKSNRCYGADLKTEGFSGYLCELLIINYGTFLNCVQEASKWLTPTLIDLEKKPDENLSKKFKVPLVVIDPVDPNRNVAAAVSVKSFYNFINACQDFLRNPNKGFFFLGEQPVYKMSEIAKEFRRRGTRWYMIKISKPKIIDDILYPQLRRCVNSIEKILKENGFRATGKGFWCDGSCVLVFEMDTWLIPKITKQVGPNIYSNHSKNFLKHYKNERVFVEEDNWVVEKEREFITVKHLLQDLLSKSEKKLKEKGIPSKIAPKFRRAKLVSGGEVLKLVNNLDREFRGYLKDWFEKNLNVI